ncbi:unnamed protein product [Angiostrongylus costaricensis]|uniref:Uncharacterized protein n=1 Tax=Angiostrongylus costaricensis TaxID=334426 RepID=A0A3P7HES4_ANGCS|nr:unnamed protein product [Angiostrongylus costaricensis]
MKTSREPFVLLELNHLNGQLPNLDLFNSVVRIISLNKFGCGVRTFKTDPTGTHVQGGEDWHFLVPLRAMYTQAFVAIEGLHSVMGKYGVQVIVSLNNVLERFHQSYFL